MKIIILPTLALVLTLVGVAAQTPPPPLSGPPPIRPAPALAPPSVAAPAPFVVTPSPTPTPAPLASRAPGGGASEVAQLAFDDTDLVDLIKILARQADINVLFDPKLIGGVTSTNTPDGRPATSPYRVPAFRMNDVTPEQAMEAILSNFNLQMVRDPRTRIARVTQRDEKQPDPLVTKIIQLKYSNPTNIMTAIAPILSTRSKSAADQRTSQIVVSATDKEWESVTAIINSLDTATKQVLIEARIMETSRKPSSVKGIDWSGTLRGQNFGFGNGNTTGTTTGTTPGAATTTTLPGGRTVTTTAGTSQSSVLTTLTGGAVPGISASTAAGFMPAVAFLNADGVRGVLSFLNQDSDTEVVATPRSVTLDNQTAKLSVTRAFPIFKITPGTSQTPAGSEVTYTNLGTILEVTPRIAPNGMISLKVIPEVSSVDGQDSQTVNGQLNQANIYAVRRIETQVTIPSGNTLVMGGLIRDDNAKSFTKVPILGDIPFLGHAFRSESKARTKSNLIIFITPTIVADSDYQATPTTFLRTKLVERAETTDNAWDSGKPKDWFRKTN